jgi:hypothetical protein
MSARVELDPGPDAELDRLEKARRWDLLGTIEDAIEALGDDPGSRESRKRAFAGGTFGIPVRYRDEDWLIIWEPETRAEEELEAEAQDEDEAVAEDVVVVRYIGLDPFA